MQRFYSCKTYPIGTRASELRKLLNDNCPYCKISGNFARVYNCDITYLGCTKCKWVVMFDEYGYVGCKVDGFAGTRHCVYYKNNLTKTLNQALLIHKLDCSTQ